VTEHLFSRDVSRRRTPPSHVAPGLAGRGAPAALAPGLARWQADALDRELAAGVDPRDSALLGMRAQQLTTPRSRRQLAGGLIRAQRDAGTELSVLTAVTAPDRHEVSAAVSDIAALRRRLRDGERVDPAGAAMLRLLLTDPTGPLYDPVGPGSLARHLRAAAAALEPHV
jgi:hypothetical protein